MAASRGRTLAVLVTLRALEPVLGYTFFSALLSLFFRTDTRKKSSCFLPGFFYRLCFGDADFYRISHRFFPFYSFPLLSHWHPLTNFFFVSPSDSARDSLPPRSPVFQWQNIPPLPFRLPAAIGVSDSCQSPAAASESIN